MAKIKIRLAHLNDSGSIASLESDCEDIPLSSSGVSRNARSRCKAAAETLRKLAAKFDALALEETPFHESTQNRINRS